MHNMFPIKVSESPVALVVWSWGQQSQQNCGLSCKC